LAEYFLPMAEAFQRFMPEVIDIANRTMTHSRADSFKAGVIEGDLRIDREGLVLTSELVPAFKGATLGAICSRPMRRLPNRISTGRRY